MSKLALRLIERDGNHCWYCGIEFLWPINPPTVEHLGHSRKTNALIRGVDKLDGLVAACLLCNHVKGRFSDIIRRYADMHHDDLRRVVWTSGG